jgi:hypothetical protein
MDDVKLERAGSGESVAGGQRLGAAAEGGGAGPGVQLVSRVWIAGVAREVIRQLAPEELEEPAVFDAMADGWLSGEMPRPRPRRRPGAAVGFGIDAVLLSELVFPILTGAVGEVLGTAAVERIRSRRRTARSPADQLVTAPEVSTSSTGASSTGASTAGASPGEVVQPTGQQMHDLHDACRRHAMTLGLPPDTAVLLADAVVGALRSATGGP